MTADGENALAARPLRAACISRLVSRLKLRLQSNPLWTTVSVVLSAATLCTITGQTLAQSTPAVSPPAVVTMPKMPAKPTLANPSWKDLSPTQQQALSPLATEWDKLDATHKSKWLALIKKFVSLKPDEQARIQERMRAWVALTPDQRRVARESYVRTKKLNTDQKSAQWEQYQQLPEDQKKKLAAETAKNKVATPPPAQSKPKIVPTLKSAPRPVLQESVRPHAGASETLGKPASLAPDSTTTNPRTAVPAPAPVAPVVVPPAEK